MSALVRGMDMPKECRECPLQEYHGRTGKTWCKPADVIIARNYKPIWFDGRPDWCPLVEVKAPHGDLIDRDALEFEYVEEVGCEGWKHCVVRSLSIKEAPVVIEAEGEE